MEKEKRLQNLISVIGSLGELAHLFYMSMIQAGATPKEAEVGMLGFIGAHIQESFEANLRKKRDEEAEE